MEQAETLAREICKADGRDPDATIAPTAMPDGAAVEPTAAVPQWRAYEAQARLMIAAQSSL